jgi:hypothetical protein
MFITLSGLAAPPSPQTAARDRLAKGLVLFVMAVLVIIAGVIGYIKYDELVEPNIPVFVCCVPSIVIASALIFFGVARRGTTFRYSAGIPPGSFNSQRIPPAGSTPPPPGADEGPIGDHHGAKKIRRREEISPETGKSRSPKGKEPIAEKRERD